MYEGQSPNTPKTGMTNGARRLGLAILQGFRRDARLRVFRSDLSEGLSLGQVPKWGVRA
jgi:hypothetical protein